LKATTILRFCGRKAADEVGLGGALTAFGRDGSYFIHGLPSWFN